MTAETIAPIGEWRFDKAVAKRAVLWLLLLAPLFYISYGAANWLASQRANVPNITFTWEHAIPFMAWTIFPYWSINFFYGLSLFLNDTPIQVDRLAKRYLTAQVVAVSCFILFPLTAIFQKPATSGASGFLFDLLGGFDKPFNQAPSLHIALLVIIWMHWHRRLSGGALRIWHAWCTLIGLSVLTTYQHHFIDIPTGVLLGVFALWLFPGDTPSPLAGFRLASDARSPKDWLILRRGQSGLCSADGAGNIQFSGLPDLSLAIAGACARCRWLFRCWCQCLSESRRRNSLLRQPVAPRSIPAWCRGQQLSVDKETRVLGSRVLRRTSWAPAEAIRVIGFCHRNRHDQ